MCTNCGQPAHSAPPTDSAYYRPTSTLDDDSGGFLLWAIFSIPVVGLAVIGVLAESALAYALAGVILAGILAYLALDL